MAKLTVEIITGERIVYQASDVDMVMAPGAEGALGILPGHAKLVSLLVAEALEGFLQVARDDTERLHLPLCIEEVQAELFHSVGRILRCWV